jgi:hypothetical protein
MDLHVVAEGYRHHDRVEVVVPIRPFAEYLEKEIDFAGNASP